MKKINLLITLLWLCNTSQAQITFFKTYYGVSSGYSVQQTNDNGYIVVGNSHLIKTDENGDTLWTKSISGRSVQQTNDSGYIVVGDNLIKTDENGDTLWTKSISGRSVQQTYDNGYIVAGDNLIKTDENGDTLWTKSLYHSEGSIGYIFYGNSVQQTYDNGYIIAGYDKDDVLGFFRACLIKTDENGDTLWYKHYVLSSDYYAKGHSVQQTYDNGYIVACSRDNSSPVYLIKTDENGNTLWIKTCAGSSSSRSPFSIQQTNDNGYIIAGQKFLGDYPSGNFIYLIKTDINGDTLWTKPRYYGQGKAYSVQQTNDNGYIITGHYSNMFLLKTDENGEGCFPFNTYKDQEICIVTVDTASGKNMIIWEKNDSVGIVSFNIYKQGSTSGVYDSIANVHFDSLSIFIDNTSNPAQHADLYKISVIDTCDFKSDLSPVHKTIHLSVSGSMAQGFELIWDEYWGFNFGTYYIYRGTNNDIVLIDSIAGNLHSWTDVNPPSNNVYYQVAVFSPNPCNPTVGSKMIYDKSVSNIADNETGINEITDNGNFDIYPNPSKGTFRLNFYVEKPENIIIQVINDLGQNVYKQEHKKFKGNYNKEINISSLKNGIYMLNIKVGENTYTKSISVVR
jgi:hypothetical protein